MRNLSVFVFLPLTVCLLAMAFHEKLRGNLLGVKWIAESEKWLGKFDRYYWVMLFIVAGGGILVRCWRFLELPLGVNQDGLMGAVEAYCLYSGGVDQYGTSWPTYFRAWDYAQMSTPYSILMIPFIHIFGLNKLSLRLPMLLVSLLSFPVVWDLGRRIAGRWYALLVLLIVATNPWHMLQSRWGIDCNLMPHVLLLAVYLLMIGSNRRWALYLSMVFFGISIYSYGLACFSVPVLLVFAAVHYLARRKAKIWDVLICVLIFVGVAGPFLYTMVINMLGLDPVRLGPVTLPFFENSLRSRDMALTSENPYLTMLDNLMEHLGTWMYVRSNEWYNTVPWTHAMYIFMSPVLCWGIYSLWRERRTLAEKNMESSLRDGGMIVLLWMLAAVFNGMMVGGVINRNNVVYYPLILLGAYALHQMGRRLRTALVLMLGMLAVSFVGMNVTYFTDEAYQRAPASPFANGLYEAMVDTWDWDYDRYYVQTVGEEDGTHAKLMRAYVMFAHQIDYAAWNEDTLLRGPDGQEIDWYFGERYAFEDITEYEPDPMECAVYIIHAGSKDHFNPDDFLITDYGDYAAVYPRYWAE